MPGQTLYDDRPVLGGIDVVSCRGKEGDAGSLCAHGFSSINATLQGYRFLFANARNRLVFLSVSTI